jgi:CheY-like chemotaxis protein/HPt (histidine-containing phosphotransfer) domain-containing protein
MPERLFNVPGALVHPAPHPHTREGAPPAVHDEAGQAARAQRTRLATLSHEFRTPLSGILGLAGLLKDTRLDERQRAYVTAIEGCTEALLTLITDIFEISRLDAGKPALRAVPFDPREVVTAVARLLEPGAHQKGLRISCRIAPEVPTRLLGDPGRIRQVLTNLAANAVKFTDAGDVVLELQLLAASGDGHTLRLSVSDTGAGIPREYQAAVFEPFRQLEDQADHHQGTSGLGLGLAICHGLVAHMGGRIGLESEPGRGSTFWVELTLPEAPASDPAPAVAETSPVAVAPLDIPLRVLVAEDDAINRMVALEMIKRLGCEVDAVDDGPGAIAALEAGTYDIVFIDVRLPGLDGPAVTAELRRREKGPGRHVPVIAITAGSATGDAERCFQAGMDDYLAKPLRPQVLHQVLVRWGRAGFNRRPQDATPFPIPVPVPPAPGDDGPSFDRRILAECCGSDRSLMADVLESFLHSTPGILTAAATGVALGAGPDLEREAHRLRGACQTIGAITMAADCSTLLALARQGDIARTPTVLDGLRNRWEAVRSEASAYLETLRRG